MQCQKKVNANYTLSRLIITSDKSANRLRTTQVNDKQKKELLRYKYSIYDKNFEHLLQRIC